jgi:hypothetical protein
MKDHTEAVYAIVLTTMAAQAEYVERELDNFGDNMLIAEELVPYFRKDWCIYLTQTMLTEITTAIMDLTNAISGGKLSLYSSTALLAALKLLRAHLRVLNTARVSLKELVGEEGYTVFKNLPDLYFNKIEPYKEQPEGEEEEKGEETDAEKAKKRK